MKKNSGFTLVELIAVITLLGVIVLVSVPVIINTLKNNEQQEYEDFEKMVVNATELYVERNRGLYPELDNIGGMIIIDTNTLIDEGYLKNNLKNPVDDASVTEYKVTVEVGTDEIFIYTLKGK